MTLPRITPTRKTGSEPFRRDSMSLGFTLLDFWRWSASDLVNNTERGVLAEFLVATAIGAPVNQVREGWAPFDLKTAEGITVEVKSAAYLQSWQQEKPSTIRFIVPKRLGWDGETGKSEREPRRHANVYVFAVLGHEDQDKTALDPLDVSQWTFYVLATKVLETRPQNQRSIALAALRKLCDPASYAELRDAVVVAARGELPS